MDYIEELQKAIRKSRIDAVRQRREALSDADWWQEARDVEIVPVLKDAVKALGLPDVGIGGRHQPKNGGSAVELRAGRPGYAHVLTFTHENGTVQVSSSESSLVEAWDDRKHVNLENVRKKVLAFVVIVASHHLEPRSIYEEDDREMP